MLGLTWLRSITFVVTTCWSIYALGDEASQQTVNQNAQLIEHYYAQGGEGLPADKVVNLAQNIIRSRRLYHGDIIAKTYMLLADVAINKGDMEQARQFSLDGLRVISLDEKIRSKLILKVAHANYSQGNFSQVKERADEVLNIASPEDITCRLLAHGYRSVYFALSSEYEKAVSELEIINRITLRNQKYADQINVLEILANAYHYLEDYETAVAIQLKILKLRFELKKLNKLGTTYYSLATAYWKMGKYDDAYNAFWEAKIEAEKLNSPIRIAYAELGLGQVLFDQGNYIQAQERLKIAESIFNGQNLTKPYLTALMMLAKVSYTLSEDDFAASLLLRAKQLTKNTALAYEQIELNRLLSQMYAKQQNFTLAWQYQEEYLDALDKHLESISAFRNTQMVPYPHQDQARKIALDIADKTKLEAQYVERYKQKNILNMSLTLISLILLSALLTMIILRRRDKHEQAYKEDEYPVDHLASSNRTKQMYQVAFKKARRYEYPICVAYIKVTNWRDLVFRTNRKGLDEAKRSIATVVNEYIEEYDLAGELNSSEYLLIFPHQTLDEAQVKINALTEALRVRFFANLGDFVVYFNYAVDSPTIQDIEPYIFLSRLTDSIKEEQYKP